MMSIKLRAQTICAQGLVAQAAPGVFLFDQLDFIAVRIFNERDHGGAAFYRTRFTRYVAAILANTFTGFSRVVYAQGDMAVGVPSSYLSTPQL
jgi:hypothetical protein